MGSGWPKTLLTLQMALDDDFGKRNGSSPIASLDWTAHSGRQQWPDLVRYVANAEGCKKCLVWIPEETWDRVMIAVDLATTRRDWRWG